MITWGKLVRVCWNVPRIGAVNAVPCKTCQKTATVTLVVKSLLWDPVVFDCTLARNACLTGSWTNPPDELSCSSNELVTTSDTFVSPEIVLLPNGTFSIVPGEPPVCPPSTYDPFQASIFETPSPTSSPTPVVTQSPTAAPVITPPATEPVLISPPTAAPTVQPTDSLPPTSETNKEKENGEGCIFQVGGCDLNGHVQQGVLRALQEHASATTTDDKNVTVFRHDVNCASTVKAQRSVLQDVILQLQEAGAAMCDFGGYDDNDKAPIRAVLLSVASASTLSPLINEITSEIPVITFESDAPDSKRIAFVGTNNTFMGEEIAKNVQQIIPDGGTYAIFASDSDKSQQRIKAFEPLMDKTGKWDAVESSPLFINLELPITSFQEMQAFLERTNPPPTAVVIMERETMESRFWEEFVDQNRFRNITYVSADGTPVQISFLLRDYVQGLVGQVPFEMGYEATRVVLGALDRIDNDSGNENPKEAIFIGTNVISHTKIPYVLPLLEMDYNFIGGLKYIGYACFAIVALCCIAVSIWVYKFRGVYVVRTSQPIFLIMISTGVLVLSSSIIPLSMDDEDHIYSDPDDYKSYSIGTCMSVPWLACIGFTCTFAAMFSKTWRINKVLNSESSFQRVQVKEKDVLVPFMVLLLANIVVLIPWTIVDPLVYERTDFSGTDGWNRVIASYGACRSENPTPYLVCLLIINMGVLVVANWQAYRARHLESEFAESKFIALTMASLFQAMLIGLPTLFLVRENPQAFYLLLVFLNFVLCMVILLLIFLPKILAAYAFSHLSPEEQAKFMRLRVRRASIRTSSRAMSFSTSAEGLSGHFDNFSAVQPRRKSIHVPDENCPVAPEELPRIPDDEKSHASDDEKSPVTAEELPRDEPINSSNDEKFPTTADDLPRDKPINVSEDETFVTVEVPREESTNVSVDEQPPARTEE